MPAGHPSMSTPEGAGGCDNMKNLKHFLFGKKDAAGRKRYWINVRTAVNREKEEFVDATLTVSLSKKAEEKFVQYSKPCKSGDTRMIRGELTDAWLKAVAFKDGPAVILFVNDFEIVVDKGATLEW